MRGISCTEVTVSCNRCKRQAMTVRGDMMTTYAQWWKNYGTSSMFIGHVLCPRSNTSLFPDSFSVDFETLCPKCIEILAGLLRQIKNAEEGDK